ncbi:hypothetical protein DFH28DRAFT_1191485 [Melampsora americana]|nr:hypothetical protein DFH28DRAFT_1191485 [Melampsora americana]
MGPKARPANMLGDMGFRSKRKRRAATPPKMTSRKAHSISVALGISTDPSTSNIPNDNELLENPELNDFLPHPDQQEVHPAPIPDAAQHFAQESHEYWNAEARRNQKQQWEAIEYQMTATYLQLQHQTINWTDRASYLDVEINCQCPDDKLVTDSLDLIDVLGYHSKREVSFCVCMSRPVRLLHYGFISSSPQSPRTAFSIPLIQYHHELWNATVISSTGFLNATLRFLNLRSGHNLKPQSKKSQSLIDNRDLRRQFSNSVNMYRSIMRCTAKIYSEGLKLSNAQLLADRCARCFGPAINEVRISPQEPHVIIALDGNFQHRHYTRSSKDNPTEEEYPEIFVKPSLMKKHEVLQNSTDAQAKNMKVTKWLLRRLRNAKSVLQESRIALTNLSSKRSSMFPTIRYSHEFLRQQWVLERESQEKRSHVQEHQKIELGRLLLLEETAETIWDKDVDNIEDAVTRLAEHNEIRKKIERQRAKIGSETILNDLTALEQDQISKIWFAKQDVRNQFVAICEQKRPLDVSRRDRKNSSIGYNDKTHLLKSLRDQAAKLKTKLETYQRLVLTYATSSPHRSQPTNITYPELLQIDFDHSFWNDGLFTNGKEPWAIDTDTQHGMRQIAYYDRANEELLRRVMRWAINSHQSLSTHILQLQTHMNSNEDALPINLPLIQHPALNCLSGPGKISAARIILNSKIVRIFNLQADWNMCIGEVVHGTPWQEGDNDLIIAWRNQIQKIQYMYSNSMISLNPGMVSILEGIEAFIPIDKQANPDPGFDSEGITNTDGDLDDDSSDEEIDMEWEDINEAMM